MLPPRLTSTGLLLVFLTGVMCLCGLLEYQHAQASGDSEQHLNTQPSGALTGFAEELPGDHGPAGEIYTVAALFAVSLGAALGLLFAGARKRLSVGAILRARRYPPPIVPPFPRIPARSRLQVFLL